jgi:hypothetical protein
MGKEIGNLLFSSALYREDFKSLDEFTALRITAAGVLPAARRIRTLLMNQLVTFGRKGSKLNVNTLQALVRNFLPLNNFAT